MIILFVKGSWSSFNETHGGDSRTTQTSSPQPSTAVEQLPPQTTNFGIVLHPPPRQSAGRLWFTMVQTPTGHHRGTIKKSSSNNPSVHRLTQLWKNNKVTGPCLRAAKGRHQSSSPSWRPDCLSHNKQQNIKENDGVCV